jgi:hypothetical protein
MQQMDRLAKKKTYKIGEVFCLEYTENPKGVAVTSQMLTSSGCFVVNYSSKKLQTYITLP